MQASEIVKRQPTTLMEYRRVSRAFPLDRRRSALSWTHHELLAAKPEAEQDAWLDRCEREALNVPELRGLLREDSPEAMLAWQAIEDVRRAADVLEEAARAVLQAVAPAGGLYVLVPALAIEQLRRALGERA